MNTTFKRKILHRAKYRGIKELDIIFERFIKKYESMIKKDELYELEQILNLPDNILLDIILKKRRMPDNLNNHVMKKIFSICNDSPKNN
jgi:antitoxin CptB